MSLNGALQIGRSGLMASQTALQVVGSNLTNAATEGYTRRVVNLESKRDQSLGYGGQFIGRGVDVSGINRVVDEALQARIRTALGDEAAAGARRNFFSQLEALQYELSDNDISSMLSEFFNGFSELANNPEDGATRAIVVQQGVSIASRIGSLRDDYELLREQIDLQIFNTVEAINDTVERIGRLNFEIAQMEVESGEAASLRDQRDVLINELSKHFEVDVIELPSGSVNILVNSLPIVLGPDAPGVEMRRRSEGGEVEVRLGIRGRGYDIIPQNGSLSALLETREQGVNEAIEQLDFFANALISEVNRVHASGQSQIPSSRYEGSVRVFLPEENLNFGDVGLPSRISNGSFMVHVTHEATGQRVAHRIDVDGNTTSMNQLVDRINQAMGGGNAAATMAPDGRLILESAAGYGLSFSDDTSGALAALGINTFFVGDSAANIDVAESIKASPGRLAVAADHIPGSNGTALAMARLQDQPIESLGGLSLRGHWQDQVNKLAVRTAQAGTDVETTSLVRESLDAQFQAVSGVSVDEETISMLTYQRQFQAASRFIATIDEALQELLRLA